MVGPVTDDGLEWGYRTRLAVGVGVSVLVTVGAVWGSVRTLGTAVPVPLAVGVGLLVGLFVFTSFWLELRGE